MRRIMRYTLVGLGVVILLLLALGALPSYLGSGTYYYLDVTPTDDDGTAVEVESVSERQYPYLTAALEADDGRSEGYQRALGDFKDAFTHSPFDEYDALTQREPDAARDDGDRVIIDIDGDRYSVEITSDAEGGDE
ncbi:MAG: hypothetical protein ACOCPZ_02375 [Natrialbaceae archaeon]